MNSLGTGSVCLPVQDITQVAEARRNVAALAAEVGFDETDAGRASLVASEMATNLVKHAGGGVLLARPADGGLELLAVDRGPGMDDPQQCLQDGYSTAGSAGTGLGAIRRQSDVFDLFSQPAAGTVVLGRLRNRQALPERSQRFLVGAVSLPIDGETVCGDGWAATITGENLRLMVFDGLGHGPDAAAATDAALELGLRHPGVRPDTLLQQVHQGIRHTRGAAGMVCDVFASGGMLRLAGVGNIAAVLVHDLTQRSLMSHNGTLGHLAMRFQEFTQGWSREDVLVLHSDGLTSRWDLSHYPGLLQRDPAVIAAVLWRDFRRGRDDATIVVVRER
jgi:anti-sigma regulatory factor (Ser/Thr protein kinase)